MRNLSNTLTSYFHPRDKQLHSRYKRLTGDGSRLRILIVCALMAGAASVAQAQNPPAFSNQSPKQPAQPGQERHFLRAPDVLPGTLPEMRTVAYWVAQMQSPDQAILSPARIQQMN